MAMLDRLPRVPQPRMLRRSRRASGLARRALLACGIAAPLSYMVGHDLLAALLYEGYSHFSQAISELSSPGAPTRPAVLGLLGVYALLTLAFGLTGRRRPTPWMGVDERIAVGAWMLWMGVLAVVLLRRGEGGTPR